MEEGQRRIANSMNAFENLVLILVVMEEGQRLDLLERMMLCGGYVLILVVMEEGQRQDIKL